MTAMEYPCEIVTDSGNGRIHRGHGLPPQSLRKDAEDAIGITDADGIRVDEVFFTWHPRIKRCERLDGFGCDLEGEWHAHWSQIKRNDDPGTQFTVVTPEWSS